MSTREPSTTTPASPVGGELRSLQRHGAATMDELREFLVSMRGKSPREMLGTLAESSLLRATVQATLGAIGLIAVFTAGPYFLGAGPVNTAPPTKGEAPPAAQNADASATTNSAAKGPTDGSAPASATAAGSAAPPADPQGGPPDLEQAAKKLGIGETKSADPQVNPLDKDFDNLLDKVK